MNTSDGNAVLVNSLSSSLRSTLNGLGTAPSLIRRVLEEESWRQFTTPRGEEVEHATFESFVTTAPTAGLGQTLVEIVRVIGDDSETLSLVAREIGVPFEALRDTVRRANGLGPVETDAHEFGAYARSGGWLFGLMVARSVKPGAAGQSAENEQRCEPFEKVPAKRFALMAGTTAARVMRFYRAWERAAAAGTVPTFQELSPGQSIDLPAPELWAEYFTKYEQTTDRRESIAQQAEVAGTSYTEAMKVAKNPAAMRTAILGDPKTAEAARKALVDRMEDDPELQTAMARTVAEVPHLKKAVSNETKKADQLEYVRRIAEEGKLKTPSGQIIEAPTDLQAEAKRHLTSVERPGDENPGMSVAEAYEAVQQLVTATIEADPKALAEEQRARVRKALTSTAKSIAAVSESPLADIADEELVREIIELQESVNALAKLVASQKGAHLRVIGSQAV
ncbi:hypothetical protein [Streptomyces sp. BPTC-684]|uniref:hypothetical protein n=1 Tax=Streptomyces sp. BPTC-684 TaxID=3043734 RepID=UPI0024B20A3A|nr:hypothetical protein [Streptomyces sp. BPTC-684]WHM37432.1 hypothetical protein QIY60_11295 [Streptomyces sp. BPTC-684]